MVLPLHLSSEKTNVILISSLTLFQPICRECIIDKNARIGKNVVIANSEVWSSHTPNNSRRSNFIFLLLGLTYYPRIHQFAGYPRSRQILRRILHPIRYHSNIEELNNPRWNCDMTSVTMSFCLFFQVALAPRKLWNMRSKSFRLSTFPHSASKYWTTGWW